MSEMNPKRADNRDWSFDPKCYELAEHFMPAEAPKRVIYELAQAIQDAVEDHIIGEEDPGIQAGAATPFAENH